MQDLAASSQHFTQTEHARGYFLVRMVGKLATPQPDSATVWQLQDSYQSIVDTNG
jgi:hypothetical protein